MSKQLRIILIIIAVFYCHYAHSQTGYSQTFELPYSAQHSTHLYDFTPHAMYVRSNGSLVVLASSDFDDHPIVVKRAFILMFDPLGNLIHYDFIPVPPTILS